MLINIDPILSPEILKTMREAAIDCELFKEVNQIQGSYK